MVSSGSGAFLGSLSAPVFGVHYSSRTTSLGDLRFLIASSLMSLSYM